MRVAEKAKFTASRLQEAGWCDLLTAPIEGKDVTADNYKVDALHRVDACLARSHLPEPGLAENLGDAAGCFFEGDVPREAFSVPLCCVSCNFHTLRPLLPLAWLSTAYTTQVEFVNTTPVEQKLSGLLAVASRKKCGIMAYGEMDDFRFSLLSGSRGNVDTATEQCRYSHKGSTDP